VDTLWASEILPAAISVTRRHFPNMLHVGDVAKLNGALLPPCTVICFGSPCTDLSVAGKREGLDGKQSSLFYEAIRIIKEMRCATDGKYPRYAIFENVPGLFSSNSGRDYKAVLEAFTESEVPMPASGKWANAGMVRSDRIDLAWCVYDAQHFGLAQRRKRCFVVADFGGTSAGEILFKPKSLYGHFAPSGEARQETPSAVGNGFALAEQTIVVEILNDQGGASLNVEKDDHAPTLRHSTHGNLPIVCLENAAQPRAVTMRLREGCEGGGKGALLQIEKSGTLATSNDQYLFCVATAQPNAEICENLCPTIAGAAGTSGNNKPYVAYGFDLQQITSKTNRSTLKDIQPSLCSAGNPHVIHPQTAERPTAYCLQGNMIGRDDRHGPAGGGINEEISYTLNGTDHHAVVAHTFGNNSLGGWNEKPATIKASGGCNGGGSENLVVKPPYPPFIVRRLTPVECERLMGFPDGWTALGHDGQPISDNKRYQMLGNSIAVPCVAYIMQGIMEQLTEEENHYGI